MRPRFGLVIAAALLAASSGGPSQAKGPEQPDVDSLLQHLDDLYRSKSSIAPIEIDVTTTRSTRNMRLRAWTRGYSAANTELRRFPGCCSCVGTLDDGRSMVVP